MVSTNPIVTAYLADENAMFECLSKPISQHDWHEALSWLGAECRRDGANRDGCHTWWVTHGAWVREGVGNDALLARALRDMLPSYTGGALTLFRGESAERYNAGRIGMCWTTKKETAVMFARGLNALYAGGGVLLSAVFSPAAVISGPGRHSEWLGESEHTIDPTALSEIELMARFPQVDVSSGASYAGE